MVGWAVRTTRQPYLAYPAYQPYPPYQTYFNLKVSSSVTITGTALPSLRPGSNRHSAAALKAASSNPVLGV